MLGRYIRGVVIDLRAELEIVVEILGLRYITERQTVSRKRACEISTLTVWERGSDYSGVKESKTQLFLEAR